MGFVFINLKSYNVNAAVSGVLFYFTLLIEFHIFIQWILILMRIQEKMWHLSSHWFLISYLTFIGSAYIYDRHLEFILLPFQLNDLSYYFSRDITYTIVILRCQENFITIKSSLWVLRSPPNLRNVIENSFWWCLN